MGFRDRLLNWLMVGGVSREVPVGLTFASGASGSRVSVSDHVEYREKMSMGVSFGHALAAIEMCAGVWQGAFERANVVVNGRSVYEDRLLGRCRYGVTSRMLGQIGRGFIRNGEVVFLKRMRPLGLYPEVYFLLGQDHNVRGEADPMFWRYDVTVNGPGRGRLDGSENYKEGMSRGRMDDVAGDRVAHFMYMTYPDAPWLGVSPLLGSKKTLDILLNVEQMLSEESEATGGYIVPVPTKHDIRSADGQVASNTQQIKEMFMRATYRMAFMDSGKVNPQGMSDDVRNLWNQIRLGFEMVDSNRAFRHDIRDDICAACGVPVSLVASGQPSASIREGMRQFSDSAVAPKLRVVAEELSHKMEEDVRIMPDLSHDISSLGRAYSALTGKEDPMSQDEAEKFLGLRY